jgi:hypothetical protein
MVEAERNSLKQVAINMIADGEPMEKIIRYTGLTYEAVDGLRD